MLREGLPQALRFAFQAWRPSLSLKARGSFSSEPSFYRSLSASRARAATMKDFRFSIEGIALARLVASLALVSTSLAHHGRINPLGPITELCGLAEPTVLHDPARFLRLFRRRIKRCRDGWRIRLLHRLLQLHQNCKIFRIHGKRPEISTTRD